MEGSHVKRMGVVLSSTALLLMLHHADASGDSAVMAPVLKTSFETEMPDEHIATIAVAMGIAGLMIVALVGCMLASVKVKLSAFIFVFQWSSVALVGVVAWGVTYDAMRIQIEDNVESLLFARGGEVKVGLIRSLEQGPRISSLVARMHTTGVIKLDNLAYPEGFNMFYTIMKEWEEFSANLDYLFWTTKHGVATGYSATSMSLSHGGDRTKIPTTMTCKGSDWWGNCTDVACTDTYVVGCGKKCGLSSYEYCFAPPTGMGVVYFNAELGSFDPKGPMKFLSTKYYNPLTRPYYRYTPNTEWMAPYVFSGDEDATEIEVGFTVITTFYDSLGAPYGVSGADYTLGGMGVYLSDKPPTKNAHVVVVNVDEQVIGTSSADTYRVETLPDGTVDRRPWNLTERQVHPFGTISKAVYGKFGTLENAMKQDSILHHGQHAISTSPFVVSGGLRLAVIIVVPYNDVLEEANQASTESLLIVVLVSALAGLLVSGVVFSVLRPLTQLSQDMNLVAWMKLDEVDVCPSRSIAAEVTSMSASFALMVENLREFKQYLPQSIQVESEAEDSSRDSESVPSGSTRASSAQSCAVKQVDTRFAMELAKNTIALVCVNRKGTHSLVNSGSNQNVHSALSEFVQSVADSAREHRGIIDIFSGDRLTIGFNTIMPVKGARVKCCSFAYGLHRNARKNVTAGIASGEVLCGNVGCPSMKRFVVLGAVVNTAFVMEAAARKWKCDLVTDESVAQAGCHQYHLRALYMIHMSHASQPLLSHSLEKETSTKNEEWMYTIEESENGGYTVYNKLVRDLYALDVKNVELDGTFGGQILEGEREALIARYNTAKEGGPEKAFALDFCEVTK